VAVALKQFARADRSGAVALILGEEAENQTVKLKWMASNRRSPLITENDR